MVTNKSGQALIEFVLLMVIVIGLSFGMKRVVMNKMGEMWKSMVDTICFPDKATYR